MDIAYTCFLLDNRKTSIMERPNHCIHAVGIGPIHFLKLRIDIQYAVKISH